MNARIYLAIFTVFLSMSQSGVEAQGARSVAKALGEALEGRGGKAALAAAGLGAAGLTAYEIKSFTDKHLADGESVYSIQMDLDSNAHAIHWARLLGYPNITPMLQIEGAGDYFIPNCVPSFKGGPVLWFFKIPQITGGRKINVIILDNTYDQNIALNQFLRTKFVGDMNPSIPVWAGIKVKVGVSGAFQILDSDKPDLPLIQPSPICSYLVTCPSHWYSSTWDTKGEMKDESGNVVGHIYMSLMPKK